MELEPWLGSIGEQNWFYPIKQDSRFFLTYSQIQARFKNLLKQHLNFKQDLIIWKEKSQFQVRSDNVKYKPSIMSKIQEW
jgi:hypothetical protein